jgi:hypothetical protein
MKDAGGQGPYQPVEHRRFNGWRSHEATRKGEKGGLLDPGMVRTGVTRRWPPG